MFAAALAEGDRTESQAALQRFLVGMAYRMEELQAHELTELIGTTVLSNEDRASLVEDVEFSLGLLSAYHRHVADYDEDDLGEAPDVRKAVGPGDLVI